MFSLSLSILFYPVFGYCRVPSVSAATRVSPLYVYDTCNMYARRSSFHLGLRCTVLFCHFVYKVQNADCLSFRRMYYSAHSELLEHFLWPRIPRRCVKLMRQQQQPDRVVPHRGQQSFKVKLLTWGSVI